MQEITRITDLPANVRFSLRNAETVLTSWEIGVRVKGQSELMSSELSLVL